MKLLPGYYNLGQPKKVVPTPDAYLSDGYAGEVEKRYASCVMRHASGEVESHASRITRHASREFVLTMGQLLYHSGKLSTQASGLIKIAPNTGRLHLSLMDMERLGLVEGDKVRVTSDRGALDMGVEPNLTLMPGACFFPEHFNEPPVKDLFSLDVDPDTGVPYFKTTKVSLTKL
jgi:formate dehydrogenase alpha subunit